MNAVRPQERRMVQVPGLVKLRSALTREGVGGSCDVMNDKVPANCAKIQITVLFPSMPEHTARINLALMLASPVNDGLFQFMVAIPSQDMLGGMFRYSL